MRFALVVMLAACGGGGSSNNGDPDSGISVDANSVDAYNGPSTTRTYQQGVGGYTGTKSVGISTYSGLGNPGEYNANGMTFADGLNDWCAGVDIPAGTYSEVWLLRFEDLGIPATATVVGATLTMYGHGDGAADLYFDGKYMNVPWYGDTPISCAGCSNSPVGWRYSNGSGSPWGALGATAAGTDTVANATFRLPASGSLATDGALAELTTSLDPAMVQGWITGANNGLRIGGGVAGHHFGYVQAQRDSGRPESMRPKLTIMLAE